MVGSIYHSPKDRLSDRRPRPWDAVVVGAADLCSDRGSSDMVLWLEKEFKCRYDAGVTAQNIPPCQKRPSPSPLPPLLCFAVSLKLMSSLDMFE